MMKTNYKLLFGTSLFLLICAVSVAAIGSTEEHFSVKEYNEFHDVLHPLQHEALPNKDFKTIRARAGELTMRGEAIVKVGVPANVKDPVGFKNELIKFAGALEKFKIDADATNTSDSKLEESYLAVHDSFEMLAGMLPRKIKG